MIIEMGFLLAAFIVGVGCGAYGHKWLAAKAASVGVTPPPKI